MKNRELYIMNNGIWKHFSKQAIPVVQSVKTHDEAEVLNKPAGFWLSLGNAWPLFLYEGIYDNEVKEGLHIYRVKVDTSKILLITKNNIDEIRDKYATKVEFGLNINNGYHIDWEKVSKDYDGVALIDISVLYGWDIPSMCIWNVKSIEKITEEGTDTEVQIDTSPVNKDSGPSIHDEIKKEIVRLKKEKEELERSKGENNG